MDNNINKQFRQWIHSFQQQLNSLDSITPEDSYRIIGQAFEQAQLTPEPSIHLLGFDDIAPLVEEQLNKATPSLQRLPSPSHPPNSLQRLQFDGPEAEMQAAAQWARKLVEDSNAETATPVRIGIITPNLGQCREQVEFAFTAEFEAHSFSPSTERYTLPFNISAGTPLGSTPLINSAINLLKLNNKQWDTSYIEGVLLSPFWGKYSIELPLRCALIERLKRAAVFTISGSTLRYEAERIDQKYQDENSNNATHNTTHSTNGIYPYFHALYTQQTAPNSLLKQSKHYPSVWVTLFLEHLDLLNWPGERTPDSQEYQQTQLWHQLLENLARLDNVLGAIDHSSAVAQLQNMANALPFQPKVPDSPIQILGILEGAGLHFTHCWIMGLHQKAWPPAPAPNSLLPISLQRDLNMPHASSLRELQYAQSLTDNYRHCADHIIFSAPNYLSDNEQALPPSQLIADIPLGTLTLAPASDSLSAWDEQLQNSNALEIVNCNTAPAYTETLIAGGTGVLTTQSANPFDSFAKYRLKASSPDQAVNGFSSGEKGNILHNALAIIWGELKDHDGLINQGDDELAQLIHNSITTCISDIRKHKFDHLSTALCEIECERQSLYISQWLNTEKTRTPFTVVAIEEAQTIRFQDKAFSIRIDRVDQLQDGSFLIIDYKSGSPSLGDWKGERPNEPQLPLYALTYNNSEIGIDTDINSTDIPPVKGISFAQINAKAQQFVGAGEANLAQGIPSLEKNRSGLPKTWEDAKAQWQQALNQLVAEYCNGDTPVKYRDNKALSQAQDYNKEILRLNRFYEAKDMARLIEASQQGAVE
jgi:probable DNA repair protein